LGIFRKFNANDVLLYVILARIDQSDPFNPKLFKSFDQEGLKAIGNGFFTYKEAKKYIQEVKSYTQKIYLAREHPQPIIPPANLGSSSVDHNPVTSGGTPYSGTPRYSPHPNDHLIHQ
jgi:hypothetical protein